ncbi:MAG: sulfatase-like hydrolase/transferase [Armatimonadota bacterium]
MSKQPNIVIIMTDQQRADLCAREGYALDTTPSLDALARSGTWFDRAYTSNPTCAPARVSMLTGRFPSATRVRSNHNIPDALYSRDLIDVVSGLGYRTAMVGKNHSHLAPDRMDFWFPMGHGGGSGPDRTEQEVAFDEYLAGLRHRTDLNPAPFPVECQGPYRCVSKAVEWIDTLGGDPFLLWLTFAEPHNPYQAPEPYFSLFPPEELPRLHTDERALAGKGFKYQWTRGMWERIFPTHADDIDRTRSNYHGMLRLIDDQVKRFVESLEARGLGDDTIIVFVADHGDFVGEYGLIRKGPGISERLIRVPLLFTGPGVVAGEQPHAAHVSIVDIMPTLCEAIGAPLPEGVQGRSLWSLLTGDEYPAAEFESVYAEQGFGGLHYTEDDDLDPAEEGAVNNGCTFDCLNSWTQSGALRMLRRGDWKLIYDMNGAGELYNLAEDPAEVDDRYDDPKAASIRQELLADLLAWTIRTQDPLPYPRHRYVYKGDRRNYWAPHR